MSENSQPPQEHTWRIFYIFTVINCSKKLSSLFSAKSGSSSFSGMVNQKKKKKKSVHHQKPKKHEVHKVPFYVLVLFQTLLLTLFNSQSLFSSVMFSAELGPQRMKPAVYFDVVDSAMVMFWHGGLWTLTEQVSMRDAVHTPECSTCQICSHIPAGSVLRSGSGRPCGRPCSPSRSRAAGGWGRTRWPRSE